MEDNVQHLTVMGYDDWFGLWRGDVLITQGHTIEINDLVRVSRGAPFTLQHISYEAVGEYLYTHGQFTHDLMLGDLLREIGS